MSYSIKNYNAFIRESKKEFGISHKEAQVVYRLIRYEYPEFKPKGVDVKRNRQIIENAVNDYKQEKQKSEADFPEDFPEDFWEEWAITFSYGEL